MASFRCSEVVCISTACECTAGKLFSTRRLCFFSFFCLFCFVLIVFSRCLSFVFFVCDLSVPCSEISDGSRKHRCPLLLFISLDSRRENPPGVDNTVQPVKGNNKNTIWRLTTQSSRLLCIPQIHAFNRRAYMQMERRGFDPLSGGSGMFYHASTETWPSAESHVVCCQWKSKGHYDLPFWSHNRERGIINTNSCYCCKWLPCRHSDPRCWG